MEGLYMTKDKNVRSTMLGVGYIINAFVCGFPTPANSV